MSEVPLYGSYVKSSPRSLGLPWGSDCPSLRERESAREKKRKKSDREYRITSLITFCSFLFPTVSTKATNSNTDWKRI